MYAPNGVLTAYSGARSTFMLPNIGCQTHHMYLLKKLGLQLPAPKSFYDQWAVFKAINNHGESKGKWRSCVMYFSHAWVEAINDDISWLPLKSYLYETAWKKTELKRNRDYYDYIFSEIQSKRNLKPNPYLSDTAKHLFLVALGHAPGYVPAVDDKSLPVYSIWEEIREGYRLEKYAPIILKPTHYWFEKDDLPVYYSLQYPSTTTFSPKSRKESSVICELRELSNIMNVFTEEFSREGSMGSDSVLYDVATHLEFDYYHNKQDIHNVIRNSFDILPGDDRFIRCVKERCEKSEQFSADGKFLRGCVRIRKKAVKK